MGDRSLGDKPNRDFEHATSLKFTSDLAAIFPLNNAKNDTEPIIGDDATDTTESFVFDDKTNRKSDDVNDLEFIYTRVLCLLLCLENFPEISTTPPPQLITQNLPWMPLQPPKIL